MLKGRSMFGRLVRRAAAKDDRTAVAVAAPKVAPVPAQALGPEVAAEAMARDRLRAFAFAAADMLVETTPDGTITFASGAFEAHFGAPASAMVGRRIASLLSPSDRAALAMALSAALVLPGSTPGSMLEKPTTAFSRAMW